MNPLLQLEVAVLAEGREWMRRQLEARAQAMVNLWGAFCPQSGELLQRRQRQRLQITSCSGTFVLKTWRGYSPAQRRWVNPTRQRLARKAQPIKLPSPAPVAPEPEFSLVVMMDGWCGSAVRTGA